MNEPKGPFDAAIEYLRRRVNLRLGPTEGIGIGDSEDYKGLTESLRQAIRILEAAGKVDREHAGQFLTIWHDLVEAWPAGTRGRAKDIICQLRVLLEALPDGGKK